MYHQITNMIKELIIEKVNIYNVLVAIKVKVK